MQVAQDPEHNHLKEIRVSGVTVGLRAVMGNGVRAGSEQTVDEHYAGRCLRCWSLASHLCRRKGQINIRLSYKLLIFDLFNL